MLFPVVESPFCLLGFSRSFLAPPNMKPPGPEPGSERYLFGNATDLSTPWHASPGAGLGVPPQREASRPQHPEGNA